MSTHYTCVIENTQTSKKYYGVRTSKTKPELDTNYMGSSEYLTEDINQLGLSCFSKRIHKTFPTRKDAEIYEYNYIKDNNLVKSNDWYNECYGGSNFSTYKKVPVVYPDGTKKLISTNHPDWLNQKCVHVNKNKPSKIKGKTWDEVMDHETCIRRKQNASNRYTGENNHFFGKQHDAEWRENHSQKMTGSGNPSYGKECSESTRRKISLKNSKHEYYYKTNNDSEWTKSSIHELVDITKLSKNTIIKYCSKNITISERNVRLSVKPQSKINVSKLIGWSFMFKPISVTDQEQDNPSS